MAKFYYTQIKRGKLTIEQIPARWYSDVLALIVKDGDDNGSTVY